MNKQEPSASENLRALCELAGGVAAGAGPVTRVGSAMGAGTDRSGSPAGLAGKPLHQRKLIGGLGFLAVTSVAAVAAVVTHWRSDIALPAKPAASATAPKPAATTSTLQVPGQAGLQAQVSWHAGELVVDFDQLPLQHAITLLAQATQATVTGLDRLQRPVFVTMHRRFSNRGLAWQELLARHTGFSLACSASSCQVAITGETTMSTPPPPAHAEELTPDGHAAPTGPDAEERLSQPDGAC